MAFAGFNNSRKRSTISNGDWDRDGVKNRKDCEPLNFRKQGPEHTDKENEAIKKAQRRHAEKRAEEYRELLNRDIDDFARGIENKNTKRRMKEIEDGYR